MRYAKDSDSLKNLKDAFEKEASHHVRYTILKDKALKNGDFGLAGVYGRLANEELAHAAVWYREYHGCEEENPLENSVAAEREEGAFAYPRRAAKAELEGYEKLADMFVDTAGVEGRHRELLEKYIGEVRGGCRYKSPKTIVWLCTVCGCAREGTSPPDRCPLCGYGCSAFEKAEG